MRDFDSPVFEEQPGLYVYDDLEKAVDAQRGVMYR